MTARPDTVAIIVPVRSMAEQVAAAIAAVRSQLREDDELLVIDDGSRDRTAEEASRAGASVITNSGRPGPYGARNYGVAHTDASLLIFMDARSRPRSGWLDSHRTLLSQPGVALSCTNVQISSSTSLAGRISRKQDQFRIDHKIRGSALDFFPTANLGVRHDAFDAVGGFRSIRSGADADLCWRTQLSGLGTIGGDARELMEWVPRGSLRGLIEQNVRYGRSSIYLERLHRATFSSAQPSEDERRRRIFHADARSVSVPPDSDPVAELGAKTLNLALRAGRVWGRLEHRHVEPDAGTTSTSPCG